MHRRLKLRAPRRVAALGAATATLCLGSAIGVAPAGAHVHVSSPGAVRASTAMLTFEVPNESETGSATTELVVTLPDVASARTETVPGWTAKLDRDTAAGTVRSVTWTAAPGGGIGADQFGLFRISVKLPDADTVSFAATQKYADGTEVHWDQPPLPDGGEPDHPAPMLMLARAPGTAAPETQVPVVAANRAQSADPSDNA
ncbi:YcnI family protein, partial [Mycobacterium talmoniae]|uniref:YcnI family copper-binding membrane protein n=1 Tax=Mycobacterium talmoniae TaxID=1858794 RepID=UPI000D53E411